MGELDDFRTVFLARQTEAEAALVRGDAEPRLALWSRRDPVSVVATLARRARPTTVITIALAGIGMCIGLLSGVTAIWQVKIVLFVVGWIVTPLQAMLQTIVQTNATDAARGRVVSLLQASLATAIVTSMAIGGVLGDAIGIRAVFLDAALIVLAAAGIAFLLFRGARLAAPAPAMFVR